jgi:hypothetical protein
MGWSLAGNVFECDRGLIFFFFFSSLTPGVSVLWLEGVPDQKWCGWLKGVISQKKVALIAPLLLHL